MGNTNELNNNQLTKKNMFDLVKSNFVEYVLIYNGNLKIKNKIIRFNDKYSDLEDAIIKKIHDMSGDADNKETIKHLLANYTSRKGKAASVYYKENSLFSIEAMLHKEPSEIFKMTDAVCVSFCNDVRSRLNTDVLPLNEYGTNPGVIIILDAKIADFLGVKTLPGTDLVSKLIGGDEVDTLITEILDILHDLDNLIPDAFIDTHSEMVDEYVQKRVEITVGTRHNILNVHARIKPSLDPAEGGTFTIKDAAGIIQKVLHMDMHGISETILRMAEYKGTMHLDGYTDKTITFRPIYRSHLDLTFDLDPI